MYQQFSQVVCGRNLPTLFHSQNPNRITNSSKTEWNSVAQCLLQPPPCYITHGKPLVAECIGEMHHEAPSLIKLVEQLNASSRNMWEASCWLQLASMLHTLNLTPTPLSCTCILPRLLLENSFSFSLDLLLSNGKSAAEWNSLLWLPWCVLRQEAVLSGLWEWFGGTWDCILQQCLLARRILLYRV